MKDRRKRNIIIGSLACLLVFMSVGYAILSATLNIKGTSIFEGNWDIIITNVEMSTTGKGVTGTYSDLAEDNKNLTLSVELQKPKDEVIYTITVKNQGSIDASLKAVNLESTNANEYIEAVNTAELGTALFAGQSMTFDVKIRFRDLDISTLPGNITAQYNFSLTYLQYTENSLVKGNENLSDNSSFTMSSDGTIIDYDHRGGDYVTIPTNIDGVKVTNVDANAFDISNVVEFACSSNATYILDGSAASQSGYIIKDKKNFDIIKEVLATWDSSITNYYHLNEIILPASCDNISKVTIDVENKKHVSFLDVTKQQIKYLNLSNFDTNNISTTAFIGLGIEELVLPKNIETIGNNAFEGNNIKNLVIPASVKSIGTAAFSNNNMKNVQILNKDIVLDASAFSDSTIETLTLDTKTASSGGAKIKNLRLLDSVETINDGAFSYNIIETLTIGKNVKSIGTYAFVANRSLKSVTIPNSVVEIGNTAFNTCGIENLTFEKTSKLKSIGSNAFSGNKITSLVLPGSLNSTIWNSAYSVFANNQISNLTIENGDINYIPAGAFKGNKLTTVTIPSSIKSINDSAFEDNLLETVNIEEGLEFLGTSCFAKNNLSSINLPKSIKTIKSNVFFNNPSVVTVLLKGKKTGDEITLEYISSTSNASNNAKYVYELD